MVKKFNMIGNDVIKVAFVGWQTNQKLQIMHDDAIEKRTSLLLERENVEQKESLEVLKIQKNHSIVRKEMLLDKEKDQSNRDKQNENEMINNIIICNP